MPDAQCARSLACKIKKHTSIVTTVTPGSPGIPRAMVLTVSFVLFPVTGLVCHRRQRKYFRRLDASVGASEPHDFAVRVSTVRQRCLRVHRIPSRVRDDREPPPVGRDARFIVLIWVKRRKEYFCKWDWTGQIRLIRFNKSRFPRLRFPGQPQPEPMLLRVIE